MDREIYNLLQSMQSDIQSFKSEMNTEMKSMKTDVQSLNTEMKSMKTDVQSLNTEMKSMNSEMKSMKSEMHKRFDTVEVKLDGLPNQFELTTEARINEVDFIVDKVNKIEKEVYVLKNKI